MSNNIQSYRKNSGRFVKEDGSDTNLADKVDELHDAIINTGEAKFQQSGSIVATKSEYREGNLSAKTTETLLDTEKEIIIHSIIYHTENLNVTTFRMELKLGDDYYVLPTGDNFKRAADRLPAEALKRSSLFDVTEDDDGYFACETTRDIRTKGCLLKAKNDRDSDHDMFLQIVYSEVN